MDYILRGNDKDVANVLKEQRIRIGRGVVAFTPISECGLVTEEDAQKTLEDKLAEKDEKISELTASITEKDGEIILLTASITEKDKFIVGLTTELDCMKALIAELEASTTADSKNLPAGDSKELSAEDTKVVAATDNTNLPLEDKKETGKKASK